MTKKEVDKILNNEFKKRLKIFKFRKKRYTYIFENELIYYYFGYGIVDSDISFPTQFDFGIGFKVVRSIIRVIVGGRFTNPQNEYFPIIGIGQSELFESKKYPILEYDIYTEEDALKMVDEVMNYFENEALPFLKPLSNLETIEKVINNEPIPQKGIFGLILAKLTGNENYEPLKSKYRDLLKEWSDWDKQELEKVISFLDNHTKEELEIIASNEK